MKNHRLAAFLLLAILCDPARAGIDGAYFAVIIDDWNGKIIQVMQRSGEAAP